MDGKSSTESSDSKEQDLKWRTRIEESCVGGEAKRRKTENNRTKFKDG
jgi:hypothetical protein